MTDVVELGAYLKDCRESLKLGLPQVAQDLRIRQRYLEAIELGNLSVLPGKAYARGYIQRYGEHLGLNGEDLMARYRDLERPPVPNTPPSPAEGPNWQVPPRLRKNMLGTAFLVMAIAVIGSLLSSAQMPETVEDIPDHYQEMAFSVGGKQEQDACLIAVRTDHPPLCFTQVGEKQSATLLKPEQHFSSRLAIAF